MKLKFEKNLRIVNDLMGYCHYLGAFDMNINLSMEPSRTRFILDAKIPKLSDEAIRSISRALSVPRQREVEQNYWTVSGEEELDGEIALVGVMTDSAEVRYNDGVLQISLERKHSSALE